MCVALSHKHDPFRGPIVIRMCRGSGNAAMLRSETDRQSVLRVGRLSAALFARSGHELGAFVRITLSLKRAGVNAKHSPNDQKEPLGLSPVPFDDLNHQQGRKSRQIERQKSASLLGLNIARQSNHAL